MTNHEGRHTPTTRTGLEHVCTRLEDPGAATHRFDLLRATKLACVDLFEPAPRHPPMIDTTRTRDWERFLDTLRSTLIEQLPTPYRTMKPRWWDTPRTWRARVLIQVRDDFIQRPRPPCLDPWPDAKAFVDAVLGSARMH